MSVIFKKYNKRVDTEVVDYCECGCPVYQHDNKIPFETESMRNECSICECSQYKKKTSMTRTERSRQH